MLPIKKIVVPTDFSEPAREGFRRARELAEHFGAELLVVHVNAPVEIIPAGHGTVAFNVADYQKEMEAAAQTRMQEVIATEKGAPVSLTPIMRKGNVAEEIAAAGAEHNADLIVMATHGYSGWKKLLLGSVTERVVRTASIPVLTINAPSGTA
jgi:nucleotide-binding universal stress UspA family protein